MKRNGLLKGGLSVLLASLFVFSAAFAAGVQPRSAYAAQLTPQQEKARLEQQIKEAENKLKELNEQSAGTQEYFDTLSDKISYLDRQYQIVSGEADDDKRRIEQLETQYSENENQIASIGSQITDVADVYGLECRRAAEITSWFEDHGVTVENIDLGGGLGVDYEDPDGAPVPDFALWFKTISDNLPVRPWQSVHVEPGRSVVAQCGTLVSRVLFVKSGETKTFLILDAGMNDLIRPALYGAYHKIENLTAGERPDISPDRTGDDGSGSGMQVYDVVGPVCESSDVWGAGRLLPRSRRGDVMAIRSAGAYGQVMSSRYNLRDLAPAVYSDDLLQLR